MHSSENSAVNYIVRFWCGENANRVKYVSAPPEKTEKAVYILRSAFFDEGVYGTADSIPSVPLKMLNGIPILFGNPTVEFRRSCVVIQADLIASAYFLISRYEEYIRPDTVDRYGRFPGRESLPFKGGFVERPVVDEYGILINRFLKQLGYPVEPVGKGEIYLTHDIDTPWKQFTFFSACKRVAADFFRNGKLKFYPFRVKKGDIEKDPLYTFPQLIRADGKLPEAKVIYFIKGNGHKRPEDAKPYINSPLFSKLLSLLLDSGARVGYHISYRAGCDPRLIPDELAQVEKVCGVKITQARNHYLASKRPADFLALLNAGVREDFTMGYADVPGFRLGTSKSIRWINPQNRELTDLLLHPLLIMDVTLTGGKYLRLDRNEMIKLGDTVLGNALAVGGDICLLWHNNDFQMSAGNLKWMLYAHFLTTVRENSNASDKKI